MSTGLLKFTVHDLLVLSPIAGPNYISCTCMTKHCQGFCEHIKVLRIQWLKSLILSISTHCLAFVALSCWCSVEFKSYFSFFSFFLCPLITLKTKLILCIIEKKRKPVWCVGATAQNTSHCGIFELSLWSHKSANTSCWTGASRACFNCSQRKRWMVKE